MCLYLRTKCQVCSIILTSFRQRGTGGNLPPPAPQNETLKSPLRLGFIKVES